MAERWKKLEEDLKTTPINLTYEQKTLLNHYIRTPLTIIKGTVDELNDGGYSMQDFDYKIIDKELREIIKVLELINNNG